MIPRAGRVLALDWGTNRIGVAISDETQLIATPLATIKRRAGKRPPLGEFLTLTEREHPVGLVVGVALDDHGREGDSAAAAREMGTLFATRSNLPVEWTDESFSTVTASERLTEAGYRKRAPRVIDAAAAATLLQGWLEQRRQQHA
jgi:putative Holliday junction resolvase